MKSKIYTIVVSFTLLGILLPISSVYACGEPWPNPQAYHIYRIYDTSELYSYDDNGCLKLKSDAIRNCELWQKMTSKKVLLEDIQKVIYKFSCDDLMRVAYLIESPNEKDTLMRNQFVKWIVQEKDKEIADFLSLAKLCEETRWAQNSPWYYPVDGDDVSITLADIAKQAQTYRGKRLADRYALQAIRALFASSQYEICINFWNNIQQSIPNGLIKEMIRPYIAGAYFRTGAIELAMNIYAECGDINSLLYCAGKQGVKTDEIEQMKLVYAHCPDSPTFAPIMQQLIRAFETNERLSGGVTDDDRVKSRQLYDLALKIIGEKKTTNRAMWCYTAAYIADFSGDTKKASNLLSIAEQSNCSNFLRESIKILRIYLDAKLLPYNSSYEQKLLGQLRWLDDKIVTNINNKIKENLDYYYLDSFKNSYYWNDMLRIIIHTVIAPKYIAQRNYVRAIQLVNIADYRLYNVCNELTYYDKREQKSKKGTMTEYRNSSDANRIDYRNSFFALVDTVGVAYVVAYAKRLDRPLSAFDRFLNERGYANQDYFNEIIGTLYLREMRYAEAIKYFEKVSPAFQYTLNTYKDGHLKRNPFDSSMFLRDRSDYKFNFARDMLSLEQIIKTTKEPNRKAQMLIRYATGIRNSTNSCWALTQYYRGGWFWGGVPTKDWTESAIWKQAQSKSDKLLEQAFSMFTDDECAAYSYWVLRNNRKVISDYPETRIAEYIRTQCDNWKDYKAHN